MRERWGCAGSGRPVGSETRPDAHRSMTACWCAKSYRAFSKSNSTSSANVSASASASASASSSASAAAPPSGSSPPAAAAAAAAFFFFFLRRETTIDPSAAKPSSWFSTAWVIVTQSAMYDDGIRNGSYAFTNVSSSFITCGGGWRVVSVGSGEW